jgi:Icc-related predicted phosphoesterase
MNPQFNSLAFSDLHGRLPKIPKKYRNADTPIFICGDTPDNNVDNFLPCIKAAGKIIPSTWADWNFRQIHKGKEAEFQNQWLDEKLIPHLKQNNINLDNVIILAGNHCFCDYESRFKNALNQGAKTIQFRGLKIGLLTGCPPLVYEWHDEIEEEEFAKRILTLDPAIDILITHSPGYGMADRAYGQNHIGSQEITKAIFGRFSGEKPYFTNLKFHIFGHAHGYPNVGVHKQDVDGRLIRFVNCAENRLDLAIDFTPQSVIE